MSFSPWQQHQQILCLLERKEKLMLILRSLPNTKSVTSSQNGLKNFHKHGLKLKKSSGGDQLEKYSHQMQLVSHQFV